MPDTDTDGTPLMVDLPAVYSQGGFVQVRTIVLQSQPANPSLAPAANDQQKPVDVLPAS
jgi:hypothetical protein